MPSAGVQECRCSRKSVVQNIQLTPYSYQCFFSKGYEDRDADSSGILAVDQLVQVSYAMHAARQATRFTKKVIVYTNGSEDLASQFVAAFNGCSIFNVDSRRIKKLAKTPVKAQVILQFEDGSETTEAFLGHAPITRAKGPFAEQLGLSTTPTGDVLANSPFAQSSVSGVFVSGDNSTPMKIVLNAQWTGSLAGAGVSAQLISEKLNVPCMF